MKRKVQDSKIVSPSPSSIDSSKSSVKSDEIDPFAFLQLFCYILSSLGMILYCCHFIFSIQDSIAFPLSQRIFLHGSAEVLILFLRYANEIAFGRWGFGDLMHHVAFLVGTYVVFYVEACIPFGWLICHMVSLLSLSCSSRLTQSTASTSYPIDIMVSRL
jgi:hypothetical protein